MNATFILDYVNGTAEQIYPCRCGQTHRGPYAAYDYGHHNCFHDVPLLRDVETRLLLCPSCGKAFEEVAE